MQLLFILFLYFCDFSQSLTFSNHKWSLCQEIKTVLPWIPVDPEENMGWRELACPCPLLPQPWIDFLRIGFQVNESKSSG